MGSVSQQLTGLALGPPQPAIQRGPGGAVRGFKVTVNVELIAHFHILPWLRRSGAIPPLRVPSWHAKI